MNFKKHIIYGLAALALLTPITHGDPISWNVNTDIPDNAASGLQDTRTVSGLQDEIVSVNVLLNIQALDGDLAWNGDFYVTLQHGSGFSVLLNRTGKTSLNPLGYSDNGFDITFTVDSADIHTYQTQSPTYNLDGQLTGTWGVDGRNVDPDDVLDTSSRSEMLSNFVGLNPNGDWTLFVADMSSGGKAKLDSWGLDITAVPEPATMTFMLAAAVAALFIKRLIV